jgi:hypothetical protein
VEASTALGWKRRLWEDKRLSGNMWGKKKGRRQVKEGQENERLGQERPRSPFQGVSSRIACKRPNFLDSHWSNEDIASG